MNNIGLLRSQFKIGEEFGQQTLNLSGVDFLFPEQPEALYQADSARDYVERTGKSGSGLFQ